MIHCITPPCADPYSPVRPKKSRELSQSAQETDLGSSVIEHHSQQSCFPGSGAWRKRGTKCDYRALTELRLRELAALLHRLCAGRSMMFLSRSCLTIRREKGCGSQLRSTNLRCEIAASLACQAACTVQHKLARLCSNEVQLSARVDCVIGIGTS